MFILQSNNLLSECCSQFCSRKCHWQIKTSFKNEKTSSKEKTYNRESGSHREFMLLVSSGLEIRDLPVVI